ncbi:MAG: O-antigen ligase family protein [Acidobacteriia bacterium]|nr:O-antigen ligase family protein [Terriglobia bacterium]
MSTAAITVPPQIGFRMRSVDLHWALLAQLAGCVLPAMAAVFVAKPLLGAQYTLASLLAVLGYHVMRRDRFAFGCIVLGSLPVLALMRGLFFYYGEVALLGGTCLMWLALSPERLVHLWRDQAWRWMTVGLLVFWWLSMLMTGSYATNLRSFEVILGSACIVLVAERRSYLATALVGMVMSAAALGFGLLPYGDRLGQGVVGETSIGNPILLGMPCALLVVISLADSGRWMLVERRLVLRIVFCLTMAELLILSGSRGSWVAALSGLMALMVFSRQDRKILLVAVACVAVVATLWLSTGRGQKIAQQFEKTVDSDRTLANRTSGRSVQWSVIPQVFAESPIWGWGPGSGKDVAAIYTGRHLGWHALYLQMIGETGLIGTSLLFVFLGALVVRGVRHWKTSHEIAPLASILTYMVVGASVSGLDAISGVFVGLALLAGDVAPRLVLAQARTASRRAA